MQSGAIFGQKWKSVSVQRFETASSPVLGWGTPAAIRSDSKSYRSELDGPHSHRSRCIEMGETGRVHHDATRTAPLSGVTINAHNPACLSRSHSRDDELLIRGTLFFHRRRAIPTLARLLAAQRSRRMVLSAAGPGSEKGPLIRRSRMPAAVP